jgi:hypothetical protein
MYQKPRPPEGLNWGTEFGDDGISGPSDVFSWRAYILANPPLYYHCRFLQLARKIRAPIHLECTERMVPTTAIMMNGLLGVYPT